MTVAQLALRLLARIGVVSFDPTLNATNQLRRGLVSGDLDEALAAINGAMQECFGLGPAELSEQDMGGVLRAPTAVTLNVTQYSTTISSFTTYASWMEGCTIRIAGDTADNVIVSSTALRRPYIGSTTSGAAATVYADAIPCSSNVRNVLGPVVIPNTSPLVAMGTRDEFLRWDNAAYTPNRSGIPPQAAYMLSKMIGRPGAWFSDTNYNASDAFTPVYLRVSPMPDRAYPIEYRAKLKPPVFVQADLYAGTAYATDPGTIIPFDWVEDTLLPIALQRFTAHPAFDNSSAAGEIARQATIAKDNFSAMKPMIAVRRGSYR